MNLLKTALLFISTVGISLVGLAQTQPKDFGWWNELHNWEVGDPHWSQYIITNPANMGPNALPIPDVYKARLDSVIQFELRFDQFSHPEDNTLDLAVEIYVPVANGKAALKITALQEWYNMSEKARNDRRARDFDPKGSATGDVLLEFKYQLISNNERYPDMSLHVGLRTASGGHFNNARFTDAPGYNFALSFGKGYHNSDKFFNHIEWNLMLGLYVWQTYAINNRQNDAPLYGLSIISTHQNWIWDNSLSGYYGYLDKGEYPEIYGDINKSDHPLVYKSQLSYLHNKWMYTAAFKKGFDSFKYDVYSLSVGYRLKPKK